MKYTGYECILGRNFNTSSSLGRSEPVISVLAAYLLLLAGTLATVYSRRRFLECTVGLNLAAILIFLAILGFVVLKKIKMFLQIDGNWSIFRLKDKLDIQLNYGFWTIFAAMVLLAFYDIRLITGKRGLVRKRTK